MRALKPYQAHRAARPAPVGNPVSDIVVCLNQIVQLTGRIYADLGQIVGAPAPTPAPHPPPVPNPGGGGGGVITWPSYAGVATPVGTSTDGLTNVFYDATLGPQGLTCAQQLVSAASAINAGNATLFGAPTGKTNVVIFALGGATDGTGGADHDGCDFQTGENIEVCVDFANPSFCQSLYEAELSECTMGGNLCGLSTGEALSRWAALLIAPNAELTQFATAPVWAADGYANWVDKTFTGTQQVPGDANPDATGCGMAFLSWLVAKHGVTWNAVAVEMVKLGNAGTLTQLAVALVGSLTATSTWPTFLADVKALPGGVTSDDPFNALAVATV